MAWFRLNSAAGLGPTPFNILYITNLLVNKALNWLNRYGVRGCTIGCLSATVVLGKRGSKDRCFSVIGQQVALITVKLLNTISMASI